MPEQHPATRRKELPSPARTPSPEISRDNRGKRLSKRETVVVGQDQQPSGFKKFFGRKKAQGLHPPPQSMTPPPHKTPPQHQPKSIPIQIPYESEPTGEAYAWEQRPAETLSGGAAHSPVIRHAARGDVSEREQLAAEQEFSRFDQGPLEDVPAMAPASLGKGLPVSPTEGAAPSPAAPHEDPARAVEAEAIPGATSPAPTHSEAPGAAPESAPAAAPATSSDFELPAAGSTDRWAQIRRNAAARAERLHAQQESIKKNASRTTEVERASGGDTAGEESIEARVARIKARVAELTGGMETPSRVPVSTRH